MALTYYDVISLTFGEKEFTSRELALRTGNKRAAKLLNELKQRGYVARVGRGRYRVLKPAERPDLRDVEWDRVRTIILDGPEPKAWTGSTAVELWTGMKYTLAPSVFLREFHLAVPRNKLSTWKAYLKKHGVPYAGKRRIGAIVRLVPSSKFDVVYVNGEPVISRSETLRCIRNHRAIYASAEELLVS